MSPVVSSTDIGCPCMSSAVAPFISSVITVCIAVMSWVCVVTVSRSRGWVGVAVAMSGSFRLVAVSGLVLCGRFGVSPVCDNSSLTCCIIYCNILNAVFKIISAGKHGNFARWCHRFHWVPPGLFWLNKVLCTIASADWRASNRGINSAAVYAAKVLARREVVATMPAGLIKTKKTKTPAQQSWAGVAPGRRSHLFNSGLSSTGVNPPAVQRSSGNHDVWKFPQRSEEIGTLPTATKI